MSIRPVPMDTSIHRHFAGQIRSGLPFKAEDIAEAIEHICDEVEALQAFTDLQMQRVDEADRRALKWGERVHRAEGRLPLLHRQVQEIWHKHIHDKMLTLEEATKAILHKIELWGAYKPL